MADKADDSKYLWQEKTSDGHTRFGLNDVAREEIGEVSFASFPDNLTEVQKGDPVFSFEGQKAVTEVHTPVAGKVAKLNTNLTDRPSLVGDPDKSKNWIAEIY